MSHLTWEKNMCFEHFNRLSKMHIQKLKHWFRNFSCAFTTTFSLHIYSLIIYSFFRSTLFDRLKVFFSYISSDYFFSAVIIIKSLIIPNESLKFVHQLTHWSDINEFKLYKCGSIRHHIHLPHQLCIAKCSFFTEWMACKWAFDWCSLHSLHISVIHLLYLVVY